jgi:asparagine synthase (glutamine-hydrolysing)
MQHFHLDIGGSAPESAGVSTATSPDGSVTAAILASTAQAQGAASLVASYLDAGRRAQPRPLGGVGYVIIDRQRCSTWVVAAPIGLRQIYWSIRGEQLRLASHPARLVASTPERRNAGPDALFQYVYFHCLPGPASIFSEVARLDGGAVLTWDGQQAQVARYWTPTFDSSARMTEAEATASLHRLLEGATRECVGTTTRFGAFLSGGLDSSTVSGYAARVQPGVPTISMGFDAQGYDEIEYARIASRHFGTRALEYYVTADDVAATLPEIAAAFAEPFGNSSAAAVYHCARIAREHGLELLLAGDGGDELFGGNERYAKQLVFERYGQIPAPLRKGLLDPAIGAAARITRGFPIGKAHSYIEQANVPLPDRLQSYNFLHRHDPADVFAPELLARVERSVPLQSLRAEYAAPKTASAVDRMLFLDWKFTLHDNDLIKVNTVCDLAGVRVAYPMLDQSLIDFSLRLPGDWKVRDGQLRWFYKRAMAGFLPSEILQKTKHGFGLPFGVWTRTHAGLQRMSVECLQSLGARGYFRNEFLRDVQRMHAEGHAAYYGELVWILMVLELWLQRHMPNARL